MKNQYLIYSKDDVYSILEQTNEIYIDNINFINKVPQNASEHILQIKYRDINDDYKWNVKYKGYDIQYFNLSIEDTVKYLWKIRKFYNNTVKKYNY